MVQRFGRFAPKIPETLRKALPGLLEARSVGATSWVLRGLGLQPELLDGSFEVFRLQQNVPFGALRTPQVLRTFGWLGKAD